MNLRAGDERPRAIGITGGIGCGKSEVARILLSMGIPVLDADDVARDAVTPGSDALAAVIRRFGTAVQRPDGSLDRASLARIVFADEAARKDLNALLHPRVRATMQAWVESQRSAGRHCAGVIPLLFETGGEGAWDGILCVVSRPEISAERLRARGWSEEQISQRRAAQWPLAEKVKRADTVIENDGTLEELVARTRAAWTSVLEKESRHGRTR